MAGPSSPKQWMSDPTAKAKAWRGAVSGAATTALTQMPFDAIYGVIAFAALGPRHAPAAVASALVGSSVTHVVATLAGSRNLVLGLRPATTLLVAGLVATLLAHPALRAADGTPDVPLLLALVALGLAMAGVVQLIFGLLKLGSLTKYLPYPVRAGFVNGVGALLVLGGVPLLLGWPAGGHPAAPQALLSTLAHGVPWAAVAVGVVTIVATLWPPRIGRFAPPGPLAGIVAGMAAHQLLLAAFPGATPSATLSAAAPSLPGAGLLLDWGRFLAEAPLRALAATLLGFAFAVALLATLDTFVAASVMDSMLRTRRDGNRELIAQGLSNIASALVGGQPSAPTTGRSLINLNAGGRTQASIWLYAGLVAATVWLAPGLLQAIPLSALGGALIVAGCHVVDDWSRRVPCQLLRRTGPGALDPHQRRTLRENYTVMLLVAGTLVFVGLAEGIVVGMIAAMVLFVRSNARALVRSVARGDVRRSAKVRVPQAAEALAAAGRCIVLMELEGTIFFGTADELTDRARRLARDADFLILGLRRVTDIDSTGARAVLDLASDLAHAGKQLIVADLGAHDARARTIRAMGGHALADSGLRFEPDVDMALQWAEDRLLERLGVCHPGQGPLTLAQTVLGADLEPQELAWLRTQMTEVRLAPGEVLFRAGDPGDALYVSLQGEVAIMLPGGSGRRLASLAPGIVVGELALLHGTPRSADAVADSPLTALRLESASFERMREERPRLWDRLMRNLTLHLSVRLRSVTVELSAALEP